MLDQLYEIAQFVDPLLGAGSFLASTGLWAWLALKNRALRRPVTVRLVLSESDQGIRLELPLHLRAGELSRAELLGRLGMLPMREQGKRFSIRSLSGLDFLVKLDQAGKTGLIEIPCTRLEIEQFDL